MTDADAAEVVANALGNTGIPESVRERVVRAAEGNPLFVEQLISMLVDSGQLHRVGDDWVAAADLNELAVPPTIQALLAARLDLLAREERAVIEPASVAGVEFAMGAVMALVPEALAEQVPEHLLAIARKQLIRTARSASFDEDGYRFHHVLIREAAYQNLLKRARSELHERFVIWADGVNAERARGGEYEEILAYHLEQAHRYLGELGPLDGHGRDLGRQASERLGAAGRRAMSRGDMPAAANLLRRAAAVIDESPERSELLIDLGEALSEMGSFTEADAVLAEAHAAAQRLADERLAAKTRVAQLAAQLYTAAEDWTAHADEAFEAALPTFEAAEDHDSLALAWRLRFGRHGMAMRFGEAAEAAEQRHRARARRRRTAATRLGGRPAMRNRSCWDRRRCPRRSSAVASCSGRSNRTGMPARSFGPRSRSSRRWTTASTRRGTSTTRRSPSCESSGRAVLAASSSIDSAQIEYLAGDLTAAERLLRADHEALDRDGRAVTPAIGRRHAWRASSTPSTSSTRRRGSRARRRPCRWTTTSTPRPCGARSSPW